MNGMTLSLGLSLTALGSGGGGADPRATLEATLRAAGVWAKLSVLQVYAAADAATAAKNMIDPVGGPTASLVGAPTFTPFKGWATNGSSQYVNTGWNPSTDAKFLQDDGTQGIYSNLGASGTGTNRGTWGPGPTPRAGTSLGFSGAAPATAQFNILANANYATSQWNPTGAWMHGASAMTRTDASTVKLHTQGVLRATNVANASVGRAPGAYWLGALNNNGSPDNYGVTSHGAFWAGQSFTDADHLVLSNALDVLMASVGNVVTPLVGWGDSLSNGTHYVGAAQQSDATGRAFRRFVSKGNSGETSAQIAVRMLADTTYNSYVQVIWAGRNDINNTNQTVDVASIKSNVAAMVAAARARSGKFLVVGVTNGNIAVNGGFNLTNSEASGTPIWTAVTQLNTDLAALYAPNFLDIRSILVAQGALGDVDDQADMALDVPPRHLMLDDVHYTSVPVSPYAYSGQNYYGKQIELKLQALGY